jgi:hypothetical protein
MKNSTDLLTQINDVIEAIHDAKSETERRVYARTALRALSRVLQKLVELTDALRKAVT